MRPNCLNKHFLYAVLISTCAAFANANFEEIAADIGLTYDQSDSTNNHDMYIISGGAAAGDFDGDGWVDLIVTRIDQKNILYRNIGGDSVSSGAGFVEVENSGIDVITNSNGVAWGDVDKDGDLDLYISTFSHDRFYFYINNGDGTFTEDAEARNLALISETGHRGTSVAFGDYDKDGWLDIFTTEWDLGKSVPGAENHQVLLRNKGAQGQPGYFENVTDAANVEITKNSGGSGILGFTPVFTDIDNDGWPDLAVASDFLSSSLFWNNGDGTFTDGTVAANVSKEASGMGSAIGDFNNDGLLDWFVSSTDDGRLYQNLGNRTFQDVTVLKNVVGYPVLRPGREGTWGWGTEFLDYDNDGDLDLIVINGEIDSSRLVSTKDKTRLYRNNYDGDDFTEISIAAGIDDDKLGRGIVVFDYDRDGDLDIFAVNSRSTPSFYKNKASKTSRWLRVKLRGTQSAPRGTGARVTMRYTDGAFQIREIVGGGQFQSQNELVAHFGLGRSATRADLKGITIDWPSGKTQIFDGIEPNEEYLITESHSYQNWLYEHFTRAERSTTAIVDRNADDDEDGLTNFFEYAMHTSPKTKSEFKFAENIAVKNVKVRSETTGQMSFTRPILGDEVVYTYEASSDLSSWNPISVTESIQQISNTNESVTVDFNTNNGNSFPLFIKVHVGAP